MINYNDCGPLVGLMINKLHGPDVYENHTRLQEVHRSSLFPGKYNARSHDSVSADNSNRPIPRPATRNDARLNVRQNFSPLIGRARARGMKNADRIGSDRISPSLRKLESPRMRLAEQLTARASNKRRAIKYP